MPDWAWLEGHLWGSTRRRSFFGPNGRISSHLPLVLSHGSWLDNTAGGMMGEEVGKEPSLSGVLKH